MFSDMMMTDVGAPPATDPYFSYVKALIQPVAGDGSILDYSSSARAVTTSGSPTLGASSPWTGYQGIALSGSAWAQVPDSADWAVGSGVPFVFEAVVYRNSSGVSHELIAQGLPSSDSAFLFNVSSSDKLVGSFWDPSEAVSQVFSAGSVAASSFVHVVTVRTAAGQLRNYIAGAVDGTGTFSGAIFNSTQPLRFGARSAPNGLNGILAAARLTIGTDRGYTGSTIPNAVTAGPFPTA